MTLAQRLGYVTEGEAVTRGFSNHASFLGIPCWIADVETEEPLIWAKWAPMEWLIPIFAAIGAFASPNSGGWPVKIGASIGEHHAR